MNTDPFNTPPNDWSTDRPHLQIASPAEERLESRVAVTRDGRRNEAFAPMFEGLELKQHLAICYSVVTRSGELVSGVKKKRHKASGSTFYCVELTAEPARALDKRDFARCLREALAA